MLGCNSVDLCYPRYGQATLGTAVLCVHGMLLLLKLKAPLRVWVPPTPGCATLSFLFPVFRPICSHSVPTRVLKPFRVSFLLVSSLAVVLGGGGVVLRRREGAVPAVLYRQQPAARTRFQGASGVFRMHHVIHERAGSWSDWADATHAPGLGSQRSPIPPPARVLSSLWISRPKFLSTKGVYFVLSHVL